MRRKVMVIIAGIFLSNLLLTNFMQQEGKKEAGMKFFILLYVKRGSTAAAPCFYFGTLTVMV